MARKGAKKNIGTTRNAACEKGGFAVREEKILKFWKERKIFEKSLAKDAPEGEFIFYDGPPFATGLPHYGSLLSSIIKDVIPRYKTMRGFHVRRRWGWDCHGLPIENMIEKQLGLKSKKDIEDIGASAFNEACRASVLRYTREWKDIIERVGRWVEFDNAYMTMDVSYMESVWWSLKKMYDNGLLYEGRKVLLYCPRCETPLAKAEIAMDHSYKDVTEEAVVVKFKVKNFKEYGLPENTFLLAWTTTPWTLPGNVALAVNAEVVYIVVKIQNSKLTGGEFFIIAKNRAEEIINEPYEIVKEMRGKEVAGLEYEPLFNIPAVRSTGKKAWFVAGADFVNTEDGTGIVHTAVFYGEDDYNFGQKLDLPLVSLLDESGRFNELSSKFLRGKYFKDAEKDIKQALENHNLLFSKFSHTHSYPHCHRCDTPLYYNAISSWFINIQKIKDKMIKLNEKINWFPGHLKHGRFLHILESAPDWTISRNRYWASPLPIWKCEKCGKVLVAGSIAELKGMTKRSGNRYFVMRHGEAENNVLGVISSKKDNEHHLTEHGRRQSRESAEKLKARGMSFDLIISSPFARTRETAHIAADIWGLSPEDVLLDDRISEVNAGTFDGKPIEEYHAYFDSLEERFSKRCPNGETYMELKQRVGDFLYEIDKKYRNKNIFIISHDSPITLLFAAAAGDDIEKIAARRRERAFYLANAEVRELDFVPLPHNGRFEIDLHRPYIDEVNIICDCGEQEADLHSSAVRVPEVVDGWVESGSMPFAEYHYPFENEKVFNKHFPGDFIAEYIAQTRTWFYYMHAIATALFNSESFKNVVTTGNILGNDGNKMSKSKGNFTDPQANIDKYGSDALRYYLMTSPVMQAEDVRFDDRSLRETYNKVVNLLYNIFQFFTTYAGESQKAENNVRSRQKNVLDRWITIRLKELYRDETKNLDAYDTLKAARPIKEFVADFSQWYIRRSRDRFRGDGKEDDRDAAIATTRFVLLELSKLIAPFMPFLAEEIYQKVNVSENSKESVHLENWPALDTENLKSDGAILEAMAEVRRIASLALEARARARIKVRQPLSELRVVGCGLGIADNPELVQLIKDETNIKEIIFEKGGSPEVRLDTAITKELEREGLMREFVRAAQDLRKKAGLSPGENAVLVFKTNEEGEFFMSENADMIKSATAFSVIKRGNVLQGKDIIIGDLKFKFEILR